MTELWGRMKETGAGDGKPGASGVPDAKEKPGVNGKTRRGAKSSSEAWGLCAEKSRYRSYRTRTADRHR